MCFPDVHCPERNLDFSAYSTSFTATWWQLYVQCFRQCWCDHLQSSDIQTEILLSYLWTRLMWSQWLWGVQRPGPSYQQPNKEGQQEPLKCIEPLQNIICGIHFGNVHVQIMISVLLMKICLSLRLTYMYRNFSFGICSILVIISVQYPFLSCVNTVLHAVLRFTHS